MFYFSVLLLEKLYMDRDISNSFKNIFIVVSLLINISAVLAVRKVEGILSREAEVVEKEKELAKKEMIIKKEFPVANSLDDINIESREFKDALKNYNIWLDLSLKDKANLKGVDVFSYTISPGAYGDKYFLFKDGKVAIYKEGGMGFGHKDYNYGMGKVDLGVDLYGKKVLFYRYQRFSQRYGYIESDWNISLAKIYADMKKISLVRVSKFVNISDI